MVMIINEVQVLGPGHYSQIPLFVKAQGLDMTSIFKNRFFKGNNFAVWRVREG